MYLQQLFLHAIPTSRPLEELEEALEEDDWFNWWISWSLELLGDSLSKWSSSKSLKISFLLIWSLTRVLIRDLALFLHPFLKWPLCPQLKHFPNAFGVDSPCLLEGLDFFPFYRNHFPWSDYTSDFYSIWRLFSSYGISQRIPFLCIWISFWMGLWKVNHTVYKSFLLHTWLCSC